MAHLGHGVCWLCGRNGSADPLDHHHIFGGAYRKKSEKYGLVVQLCHHDCHIFGEDAVHANRETMLELKAWGQRKAMRENGWSVEDFRREFGKNYIEEENETYEEEVYEGFRLTPALSLPF